MASKAEVKPNVDTNSTPPPAVQTTQPSQPLAFVKRQFLTADEQARLQDYAYYEQLFLGEHFEAFNIRIKDAQYTQNYGKLRYVMANFAGLVTKIVADLLFSEPIKIKAQSKETQAFCDALITQNQLNVQFYESALANSYFGDDLFKLRVGQRHPDNLREASTVIIEESSPMIYLPRINKFNVKEDPREKVLGWKFNYGDKQYARLETHTFGKITNKFYVLKGNELEAEVSPEEVGSADVKPEEELKIDESLLIHIPNWKTGNRYFGISDYKDLTNLFYGINNRLTSVDNILDKHSDPILMVPSGILDDKGRVKKKALGVIEYQEGETGKPEYIVWDASLENAFKEIDKLVELLFMISETSPDILGMGQGQADSGKALKLKLLRTIAKTKRKRLYYHANIQKMLYTAQLLSTAYGAKVDGLSPGKIEMPDIEWQDGLPSDDMEQAQIEQIRLDSGTSTKEDAIMRLDGVDEETAKKKAEQIEEENKIELPTMGLGTPTTGKPNPIKPNAQQTKPPAK